jgi:hypothetical protein
MSISAMKYALDVLDNYVEDPRCETERVAAVNLLRQALEQPDLARVGEVGIWGDKREWVGLTDDEIWDCYTDQGKRFYLAIEAKLKEKNT